MGKLLDLISFAVIINGLAVWFELSGGLGAFLAVPSTAMTTIVFTEFPGARPTAVLSPRRGRI
jgi:predicted PurR-regulated permease PerM